MTTTNQLRACKSLQYDCTVHLSVWSALTSSANHLYDNFY